MAKPLWRNDSTLYQTVHTQAGFVVLAHVSHMDDWVVHVKLKILAYVQVQTNDIHLLNCLFSCTLYWRRMASVRPPYWASRIHSGLCLKIGFVRSSEL